MKCEAKIATGPREGNPCRYRACRIVTSKWREGLLVCAVHARAWLPAGTARIAYYDPKTDSWP